MSDDEAGRPNDAGPSWLQKLSAAERQSLIKSLGEELSQTIGQALPTLLTPALHEIGLTSEVIGLAQLLAAKDGGSQEDVFRKALTLYGVASNAVQEGNRLAILSPDDEIVREIEGIGSRRPRTELVAK